MEIIDLRDCVRNPNLKGWEPVKPWEDSCTKYRIGCGTGDRDLNPPETWSRERKRIAAAWRKLEKNGENPQAVIVRNYGWDIYCPV